jgi:hypothetical protein
LKAAQEITAAVAAEYSEGKGEQAAAKEATREGDAEELPFISAGKTAKVHVPALR